MRTLLVTALLFATTVAAADAAAPTRKLKAVASMNGYCDKFIAYGKDLTDRCESKVVNSEYSDGRNSFTFVSDDGALVITFSGDGKKQTHPDPSVAVQPLDTVIAGFKGKTENFKVVGSCRFSNPYAGRAPVRCIVQAAQGTQGEFAASFMSDGDEPTLQEFK